MSKFLAVLLVFSLQPAALAGEEGDDVAPLDAWRQVQEACRAAVNEPETEERIIQCEKFLKEHGDHEDKKPLLKALIDAYLETDDFKPERVGELVVMLASLDDSSYSEPASLVRTYHLKHGLPLDSADTLFQMSAERIERERGKLDDIEDEKRRESTKSRYEYWENRALTLEGMLLLEHGDVEGAMTVLQKAESNMADFPHGIVVRDAQGNEVRVLSTGLLDELHLGLASANARAGNTETAQSYFESILGFFDDKKLEAMSEKLRAELGVPAPEGLEISAPAVPAHEFTLEDLEGNKVSLADYRGKVVLVNFWATWCGPCRLEMPILQRFEKTHADKGVVVLAVSTDRFEDRSQIKPFLTKNNFDFKVLLAEDEQLTGYNKEAIPSLYVVDREGLIALARTGYDPDMKEKLEGQILGIINGEPNRGRPLVTVEKSPSDFGVLWMEPVEGSLSALTIASPLGDQEGEVAAVGRPGLMRWSASGEHIANAPLQGRARELVAADLDGNGKREWILTGWSDVKVLDSTGELYWSHEPGARGLELTTVRDLDGDGLMEIVIKGQNRITALRFVPDPLWDNPDVPELQAVRYDPAGTLVAQIDDRLHVLNAAGAASEEALEVRGGFTHSGRIALGESRWLDFFAGQWDRAPMLDHDIDGDGRNDVVIATWGGIEAYDIDGTPILRIKGEDTSFDVAIGDLDGRPGDEIVLSVRHYGLIALGRKAVPADQVAQR